MRLVWSTVTAVLSEAPGIQRVSVGPEGGEASGAICYPALSGICAVGDRVLLNTTAVDLALGTGGWHFVVARDAGESPLAETPRGAIMKLRYTPAQCDVAAVEESPGTRAVMAEATDLGGIPVVCCGLHSQLGAVAASIRAARPAARIAYVMADAAALPLALSDHIRQCVAAGIVDVTVTTGQAFGGDIEAVTLHSGLLAARHVASADVAIVAIGPGVAGTGTPFGHGGIAQAQAIDAATVLGGRPVAVLRLSFADARERHRGVSHHTLGVLGTIALGRALVAVPRLPEDEARAVDEALESTRVWLRHDRADAEGLLLAPDGVVMRTMGRSSAEDPAFFAAAAAAGEVAASLIP